MTPFNIYKFYVALKRHFNDEKYDFFKYRGKLRLNESSFENRKDKYLFTKLAAQDDCISLVVAGVTSNPSIYVTDLLSEDCKRLQKRYRKYHQSFEYSFKEEIKKYNNFDKAIKVEEGQYPEIISDLLRDEISLDTVSVVDKIINGCEYWSRHLTDPMWEDINMKLMKYRPFVDINTKKYKTIIMNTFGQNENTGK